LLYFFDESRFGTHSKIGREWFKTGLRTAVSVKLGFKNFYLYSAVCPKNGKDFSLIIDTVNAKCFEAFLYEFSISIAEQKVILVIDGAGWHRANDLKIPDNIELFFLPPYSPELNPVERLWRFIKQHTIRNKVFEILTALENSLKNFINHLKPSDFASICRIKYL
jgi:transposase